MIGKAALKGQIIVGNQVPPEACQDAQIRIDPDLYTCAGNQAQMNVTLRVPKAGTRNFDRIKADLETAFDVHLQLIVLGRYEVSDPPVNRNTGIVYTERQIR